MPNSCGLAGRAERGVETLVRDGDSVALEGFTHLIPFAAGHELLRQGRTELELWVLVGRRGSIVIGPFGTALYD